MAQTLEQMVEALRTKEVLVTFDKSDGTERVMRCTLDESRGAPKCETPINGRAVTVWDLEKTGWRTFFSPKKFEIQ